MVAAAKAPPEWAAKTASRRLRLDHALDTGSTIKYLAIADF